MFSAANIGLYGGALLTLIGVFVEGPWTGMGIALLISGYVIQFEEHLSQIRKALSIITIIAMDEHVAKGGEMIKRHKIEVTGEAES